MRSPAIWIVLAACGGTDGRVDYPQLAAALGASVATPDAGGETGALADTAIIARGGLPVGFTNDDGIVTGAHDGVRYTYLVSCQDLSGVQTACSPTVGKAIAIAEWSTPTQRRTGSWTLEHLQGDVASVTGESSLIHTGDGMNVTDERNEAFLVDMNSYQPTSGDIATELTVTSDDNKVIDGSIQFDASRLAMLSLPDNVYQIDLDTGDVVPISIPR